MLRNLKVDFCGTCQDYEFKFPLFDVDITFLFKKTQSLTVNETILCGETEPQRQFFPAFCHQKP